MDYIHIKNILSTDNEIIAHLLINGNSESINTVVSDNMTDYITIDRCDAFIIGLIYFAMSHGYDIKSDVPISEDLLYNLQYHFIDSLANESTGLYRTRLIIPTITCCEHIGDAVATGISCGIDCLYTLSVHEKSELTAHKITHLAFYNVGSHHTGRKAEEDEVLYKGRYSLCKQFADEYGYTFYTVSSNIHQLIHRNGGYSHVNNHSFMAAFCILLLQKGISRYYYSSGYSYSHFRLKKSYKKEELDSAMYDLLTFNTISVGTLKAYSAGGSLSRLEKTRELVTYLPAQKYLNVCVRKPYNEGTCFKCVRTLLSLDATGNIDDFGEVFDIEDYKKKKQYYLRKTWIDATFNHDEFCQEILFLYKNKITVLFRIIALLEQTISLLKRIKS